MSLEDVLRPPMRLVRLDAMAVGAKDLDIFHFLFPEHDADAHWIPAMCRLVFLACIDVVDIKHTRVADPALNAFATKCGHNGEFSLPIPRASSFVSLAFAPVPMTAPAFRIAETPTRWRRIPARWAFWF